MAVRPRVSETWATFMACGRSCLLANTSTFTSRSSGSLNITTDGAVISGLDITDGIDVVHLAYAQFRSTLVQEPQVEQIIPIRPSKTEAKTGPSAHVAIEYEPDEEEILKVLLPRNIAVQIYHALLENQAGFYGSQMTAMDNATRNAGDMINKLSIQYNRQRQAVITTELIEIISGAEAL